MAKLAISMSQVVNRNALTSIEIPNLTPELVLGGRVNN